MLVLLQCLIIIITIIFIIIFIIIIIIIIIIITIQRFSAQLNGLQNPIQLHKKTSTEAEMLINIWW